jgi:hypothetical protein
MRVLHRRVRAKVRAVAGPVNMGPWIGWFAWRLRQGSRGGAVSGVVYRCALDPPAWLGGAPVVFDVVALMVVLETAWSSSLLYLRTERGRAASDECGQAGAMGGHNTDRTRER